MRPAQTALSAPRLPWSPCPEQALILLSARHFLGTAGDEESAPLLRQGLDWDLIHRKAGEEGVNGLVATLLGVIRSPGLELPLTRFTESLRETFAHTGGFFAELSWMRRVLRKKRLGAIVLKGGGLIERVYLGQMGLRPLSDIDLLVKPADHPFIRQQLLDRGFRTPSPHSSFFSNGRVAFDLHADLIGATRIQRRRNAFRFDLDAIWAEALPFDGRDDTLLVLSDSHQFLHLAVHALKHSYSRLIWIVDLALLFPRLNWQQTLDQAEASGSVRALAYAVGMLDKVMALNIPVELQNSLPCLNKIEDTFLHIVEKRESGMEAFGELIVVFSILGWKERLGYLWEYLFPNRSVVKEVFPGTPSSLVYFRRVGQLVSHGFSQARCLLGMMTRSLSHSLTRDRYERDSR